MGGVTLDGPAPGSVIAVAPAETETSIQIVRQRHEVGEIAVFGVGGAGTDEGDGGEDHGDQGVAQSHGASFLVWHELARWLMSVSCGN